MQQPLTFAAGIRRRYDDLPPQVHDWVAAQLGERAAAVRDMTGGFSPGVAAVVTGPSGRALFLKAVGSDVNPDALRFYRQERDVTLRIPPLPGVLTPVAWADLEVDGETFALIAFPALAGATPMHPWRPADLRATLAALQSISSALTPSPWPPDPDRRLVQFFCWWAAVAAAEDDPWAVDPWIGRRLTALVAVEDELRAELLGQTLSHTDLRADNVVLTQERVWFVDWAHAQNAAQWVDAAILVGDVVASRADRADGGDIDIAGLIREHPIFRHVSFEQVWRLVTSLAGALHGMSRQPPPSGLPTIRAWQSLTADTMISWSQRESPIG